MGFLFIAFSDRNTYTGVPRVPFASLISPQALISVAVGDKKPMSFDSKAGDNLKEAAFSDDLFHH